MPTTPTAPRRDEDLDTYLNRIWGSEIKPGREERILSEDRKLAEVVAHKLAAEPSPDGVYAPITLARPTDVAPVAYVMHNYTSRCTICNTEHRWSEMYALNHLRTAYKGVDGVARPGYTYVRHQVPIAKLEWNVPLRVHNLATKTVAGCFECFDAVRDTILPSLPEPPVPQAVSNPIAGTASAATAGARPQREPKKPVSTDDFLV